MKEKAPYMPFFGREFYGDLNVMAQDLEEQGAYHRLNWLCWQEGAIPSDVATLAAICGAPLARFKKKIWPKLCGLFETIPDGRLVHRKIESIRNGKELFRKKCSEAGKLGNERRWGRDRVPDANPIDTRSGSVSGIDRKTVASDFRSPISNTEDTNTCSFSNEGDGREELPTRAPWTMEVDLADRDYLTEYIAEFHNTNERWPEPEECPIRFRELTRDDNGLVVGMEQVEWDLGAMPFRRPSSWGMVHVYPQDYIDRWNAALPPAEL